MATSGSNPNLGKDRDSTSRSQCDDTSLRRAQVLIVEDNQADLFLIREALQSGGIVADVHVVHDGRQAMEFLDAASAGKGAPCPDLILLDLNLPKKSGNDVLRHLRESQTCRNAAVLVVTSSDSAKDRESAAALGAADYFSKPSDYEEFMKLSMIVKRILAGS